MIAAGIDSPRFDRLLSWSHIFVFHSSSDDDDETAELMRELERIQKERQEEQKRLEKERANADLATKAESILRGNPLHGAGKDDFTVKKKYVFMSCRFAAFESWLTIS